MKTKLLMLPSIMLICTFIFLISLGRSHAQEPEAGGEFCPSYVSAGRVFMGTVALSLFADEEHVAVCRAILSKGKQQSSPARQSELQSIRKQLRDILVKEPNALDAYVALSQIDRAFRQKEYNRMSHLPSNSKRVEFIKKEWMDWCHIWDERSLSKQPDQEKIALSIKRMNQRWEERHDLMVGVMLLEMSTWYDPTKIGPTRAALIKDLAGEEVWEKYIQPGQQKFRGDPPSVASVPKRNLRPLLGVVENLYCSSSTQAIHPDLYTTTGAFVTKTPLRSDMQNEQMNYFKRWGDMIESRYKSLN